MPAAAKKLPSTPFEQDMMEDIAEFYDDPYGYIMYAFPWLIGELESSAGPDRWQEEQLVSIGDAFVQDPECVIRQATASGHGIGKSALVAWIILWAMSTRPHLSGVITANTSKQLSDKTWRELALWHKRAINKHWFKWTATKFVHIEHPETWFCAAVPNTEHNSEAFAGLHAKHVLVIYDEASAIPDIIWEVSEGAMTTPRSMWFVYGNPTKNTGRFRECFHTQAYRWRPRQIDSRDCKMTEKKVLQDWIKTYGEDSDFCRVRIKGEFPRAGTMQFIDSDTVDYCMLQEARYESYYLMPIVVGVDVARYGDDKTVIVIRQGRKILEMKRFRELNTMEVATEVIFVLREYSPAVTFVDGVGIGAGVVDRCRQLGYDIVEVNAGTKPYEEKTYYNKRAEMWDRMRIWLKATGPETAADIPYDTELRKSLIGLEYGFTDAKTGELMRLERKQDMKKRGLNSPDEGDALAMTFAEVIGDMDTRFFEPEMNFEPEYLE